MLATAFQAGTVLLWDIDPASWRARACAVAGRRLTEQEDVLPLNQGRPAGWLAAVQGRQAQSPTGDEWWNDPMPTSASDQELLARQAALQAEATQVLAELDLGQLFADVGPVLVVGSYLSGLMCWRDLDVCLLAGADCSPSDVLELLKRVVELPGFVGFSYRDERGARCPTGQARDERYHVPFDLDIGQGRWRIDLSVWLRDLHAHVADWHKELRDTITDQQRLAVLRIKDVWHRLPSYPDEVSGWEIYTAVLGDGVRTPEQFARWLAAHGFPSRDAAAPSATARPS